jgi:hypothetical protein
MTNDKNRGCPWRRTAALAVAVGAVLLATACSSSSSSSSASTTADGSSAIQKMDAYADCLTSHGATGISVTTNGALKVSENGLNFEGNGGIPTSGSISLPASLESAAKACKSLAPAQATPSAAQQQQNMQQLLKYAQCMRTHGVPNFPDPTSNGAISFNANSGVNPQSATYQKANTACESLAPGLAQLPAAP